MVISIYLGYNYSSDLCSKKIIYKLNIVVKIILSLLMKNSHLM